MQKDSCRMDAYRIEPRLPTLTYWWCYVRYEENRTVNTFIPL